MARHRGWMVIVGALVLTAPFGCGDDEEPAGGSPTEPGTVFEVDVGDEVVISLESNATTGYAWQLETEPLVDVVRLVGDSYVEPDTDLVGAGGRQDLTFEAVGEGTAEIALWYVRDFDDPKDPSDRAQFEIVVGG